MRIVDNQEMNERTFTPQSQGNPDKLDIHARGLDHVRTVYREGNQGNNACPRRS